MSSSSRIFTIDVIDDDRDVLGSLRFLLETEGFHVRTFLSGAACLSQLATHSPDCFVIDYKLNGMNGLELVQELHERGQKAPVILITGYPDDEIGRKAADAGIQHVVLKPHVEENLITEVRTAMGRSGKTARKNLPEDIR